MIELNWSDFKAYADLNELPIQYTSVLNTYLLRAFNGPFEVSAQIPIEAPPNADQTDFEDNYQAAANAPIGLRDDDGISLVRVLPAGKNQLYQPRSISWTTAKRASVWNERLNGNDRGDVSIKFYNAGGSELIQGGAETDANYQTRLDNQCVQTEVDYLPTYTFRLIKVDLALFQTPTESAYLFCNRAPDRTPPNGGPIRFIQGYNLFSAAIGTTIIFDSGTLNRFVDDPIDFTNLFRFVIRHIVGDKIGINLTIHQFRNQ
jgi:hypothetical protein